MKTKELRTDFWKENKGETEVHYNEALDTLFMYFSQEEKEKVITHFVDEFVAFLYRRSDKQIIGMRIEYFKGAFIPKAVENKGWKLSSTGEELQGFRDLDVEFKIVEKKPAVKQFTIPKPIEENIRLKPVYA